MWQEYFEASYIELRKHDKPNHIISRYLSICYAKLTIILERLNMCKTSKPRKFTWRVQLNIKILKRHLIH
jgi:hypothetical protein